MVYILLWVVIIISALTSLTMPWISIIAYNIMSVMQPQIIWFWAFYEFPVFRVFAGLSLFSFIIAILQSKIDFKILKNKQNYALLIIFIMVHLSDSFSPLENYRAKFGADFLFMNLNPIFLFYFVSQLILNRDEKVLKYLIFAFIAVITYYVYWSNDAFFNLDLSKFRQGRLQGPRYGPYQDENKFATVFVIGLPFLIFGFFYFKNLYVKAAIALIGPLLLHSIFLTGSRGALLAVAVTVLMSSKMIKSKTFSILLLIAFALAVVYQAGTTLNRSEQSVESAKSDEEVNPRIRSWTIGVELIKRYPLLGVGATRFSYASRVFFPEFNSGYVAHNTFFQIASNSGLLAGLLFLYIYYFNFKLYLKAVKNNISDYPFLEYANKSIFVSLTGFYVTAVFLNMLIFEGFYFLLLLSITTHYIFNQKLAANESKKILHLKNKN